MGYEINEELIGSPLSEEEKTKIKDDLTNSIYPDDIVCLILSHFPEFTMETNKIHIGFYELKENHPDHFEEFSFNTNGIYPYSELLERVFFRLKLCNMLHWLTPYPEKYFFSSEKVIEKIQEDYQPKFDEEEVAKMVEEITPFIVLEEAIQV